MMRKNILPIFFTCLMANGLYSQENPGLGDVSNSFYDTFDDNKIDNTKWEILNRKWSINNGGVVPENISEANGYLKVEAHGNFYSGTVKGHDQNTKVGGVIKTKSKMGPGTFEVRAKICPQMGALTTFWTFEYGTDGANGYSEIDFETPGDLSLNKIICTNWISETIMDSKVIPVTQNDGNFHTYKFEWYPASVTNKPYVKYYFDNELIATSTTKVPNYDAAFNVGVWFPNNWAGTPDFDTDYMYVDWVKITPLSLINHIALNKPAVASSYSKEGYEARKAFDGLPGKCWTSSIADTQWIYVDLQDTYKITDVKISWDSAAYAKNYEIQVSSDASSWKTIKTITENSSLINTINDLSVSGQYVRLLATSKNPDSKYTICEMEIYGKKVNTGFFKKDYSKRSKNKISFYPNPVSESLKINIGNERTAYVTISSLEGRILYQTQKEGPFFEINIAQLNTNGWAVLTVSTLSESNKYKVFIQ